MKKLANIILGIIEIILVIAINYLIFAGLTWLFCLIFELKFTWLKALAFYGFSILFGLLTTPADKKRK